jgi:hypothetical protein
MANVEISVETNGVVGYYHYTKSISPIKRLYVKSDEDIDDVKISVTSSPEFLLPVEFGGETLPRRSKVNFDVKPAMSPPFLVGLDRAEEGEIIVKAIKGKELLAETRASIRILGYNVLRYKENAEMIATFVRRSTVVSEIVTAARRQLGKWRKNDVVNGYKGNSKNDVRNVFASIYKTLMDRSFIMSEEKDDGEIEIASHKSMTDSLLVKPIELSLLFASALEAFGLNPVIIKTEGEWLVGVWLHEECFPELVIDESEFITRRMALGVSEFTMASTADVFNRVAFEHAEKRAVDIVDASFEFALDVKRARIGRIFALPERVRKAGGYDLVDDNIYDADDVPEDIKEYDGDVSIDRKMTREKQWERRLLDLSMRNPLVNFKPNSSAVKIVSSGIRDFSDRFSGDKEYSVMPRPKGISSLESFDSHITLRPEVDLVNISLNNLKLHTVIEGDAFDKTMTNIYRKDKTFLEESGTNSLYIAVGFLRWQSDEEKKYAPLFLYPVTLSKKSAASDKYTVKLIEDEIRINNTLLEYLYQEFGIDLRGLRNISEFNGETMSAVIGRIRREIIDRKSWDITDDIYLTTLSFANYLMWKDVREKLELFKSSKIISGLLDTGKTVFTKEDYTLSELTSDNSYEDGGVYLPISADSSQYSAIVDSLSKSFVLHGPPGTGKSQTICNIIANNILRGKRVLFVAEKTAALSVVKKRLDDIGLSPFCLELHSNKNNKNDVVKKLSDTMNLRESEDASGYSEKADEIRSIISGIDAGMKALHKKRKLGVSVYEGAMRYLENEDASSTLKIEPMFYERLTEDSLSKYEEILTELTVVGRECGDISGSPFRHVGYINYESDTREKGEEIIDILSLEIEYLREYARKFTDLFRIRTVAITGARLKAMYDICRLVSESDAVKEFFKNKKRWDNAYGVIESYKANKARYNALYKECLSLYEYIPDDLPKEALVTSSDRKLSRLISKTARRMDRLAIREVGNDPEENVRLLIGLFEAERECEKIRAEVSKIFGGKCGVEEAVKDMDTLTASAKVLYADFRRESFESIVEDVICGKYMPSYFMKAYESYSSAYGDAKKLFDFTFDTDSADIADLTVYLKRLRDNLDLMPSWCKYNSLLKECKETGLSFVVEPLRSGNITTGELLKSFRKCVYGNFVESELALDTALSTFSGKSVEDKIERLKILTDNYETLTRREMYMRMVANIPRKDEEGAHNLEMVVLSRAEKSNMKGITLRKLFTEIPTVMKYASPCMLMSPVSVTQYLDPELDKFDLVVFDEASQMPTSEAIGAIARAERVIVVGDPKQLPPTKFFNSEYKDEENADIEDLESILDDCLALGMPERHLLWHYRSHDESLIAFSNAMYYDNRLLTFPSPDELDSKVKFRYVEGVYERGGSKRNKAEAEALVNEVIERLTDGKHMSIGIVTFNTAQQNYIEDMLHDEIKKRKLYVEAYECDEPIFVKNLENVQGDERDVILFSIGYGPDAGGKLSLNFGPINQSGGYRRLNVAITRARSEMVVFSSITGNMIDLNKTDSKGVKGLKAFLEYAERGRDMLVVDSKNVAKRVSRDIGWYIANDLKERGFECEYDVGVSDFKIDVAVVDPKNKDRYILAIMCDGRNANNIGSVRDRMSMNVNILKKLGWNVYYLWTVSYLNNSKREVQKIKDYLMTFTRSKAPSKKAVKETISKYRKAYKGYNAKPWAKGSNDYILNEENGDAIFERIMDVIAVETPIEQELLMSRLMSIYNVTKANKKACSRLIEIANRVAQSERFGDKIFYRTAREDSYDSFRPIDELRGKREIDQVHPNEIITAMRCVLESKVKLDKEELKKEALAVLNYSRKTKIAPVWLDMCVKIGVERGKLIETLNNMVTM